MKKKQKLFAKRKDESGNIMIIAALGLVVFLSVASLVTDLGLRYYQKSRLQSALDSAALASVTSLPNKEKAKAVALEYVRKNGFETDNTVVEFPEEGVVRVSDTYECRTLFASVFSEDSMTMQARAAAKYIEKNMAIDFDYLMFYGEDSPFNLNGDFREVDGSIYANGDIMVGCNDAAVIKDIASAKNIVFKNQMGYRPSVRDHVSHQEMPDWDEMIMSVTPKAEERQFTAPYAHITSGSVYKYYLTGDTYVSNFGAYAGGSVYCSGSLNTNYSSSELYIHGNLYVNGNFTPQCPVRVTGNVYVDGDFKPSWGTKVTVGGDLYVKGGISLQGETAVTGTLYCGKDLNIMNGNGTVYKFSAIRCMGNFSTTSAWNAKVTVKGNMNIYGKLALGGGQNNITGNIYVWGKGAVAGEDVCYINGNLYLKGDVWSHSEKGVLAFGGNGDCEIHGIIYSGGGIETRSGGDISLNGCMVAEGDINIGGASHTYNDSGATLSLYSRRGNINLGSQGSELKMWGIVYAPKGDIKISTNGLMIYGSLVGNTLTCNIGSGFYIGHNDRTLPFAKTVKCAALIE